jgi:hypothetical protein
MMTELISASGAPSPTLPTEGEGVGRWMRKGRGA